MLKNLFREFWLPVFVAVVIIAIAFVFAGKSRADDGSQWKIECRNGQCQWVQTSAPKPPQAMPVGPAPKVAVPQTCEPPLAPRLKLPLLRPAVQRTLHAVQFVAHHRPIAAAIACRFSPFMRRCK